MYITPRAPPEYYMKCTNTFFVRAYKFKATYKIIAADNEKRPWNADRASTEATFGLNVYYSSKKKERKKKKKQKKEIKKKKKNKKNIYIYIYIQHP